MNNNGISTIEITIANHTMEGGVDGFVGWLATQFHLAEEPGGFLEYAVPQLRITDRGDQYDRRSAALEALSQHNGSLIDAIKAYRNLCEKKLGFRPGLLESKELVEQVKRELTV